MNNLKQVLAPSKQKNSKLLAMVITLCLLASFICMPGVAKAADLGTVAEVFPDAVLRSVIKPQTGLNDGDTVTDADLAAITALDLSGTAVWKLEGLQYLTELQSLNLSGCTNIAAADGVAANSQLRHLAGLTNVTSLDLSGCSSLGEADMSAIGNMSSLRELNLSNCINIGDAALANIAGLSGLTTLNLEDCTNVGDNGLKEVAKLTALTELNVANASISSYGLKHLITLTNMESLNIDGIDLSIMNPAVFAEMVANMPNLTNLVQDTYPDPSDLENALQNTTFKMAAVSNDAQPIVVDNPYPGWAATDISDGGTYDGSTDKITWPAQNASKNLTFKVTGGISGIDFTVSVTVPYTSTSVFTISIDDGKGGVTTTTAQYGETLTKPEDVVPLAHFTFDGKWYTDAALTNEWNFATDTVTGAMTLYAGLREDAFVTIDASAGANGTITPSGAVKVYVGEIQTFAVTAATGYEVDTVLVNGVAKTLTDGKITVTGGDGTSAILVTFKVIGAAGSETGKTPGTGDNTQLTLLWVAGALAIAGISIVLVKRFKVAKDNQ